MSFLKITALVFLAVFSSFAQISQNKNVCSLFNEMPFAELHMGGVGSSGFDAPLGYYNPTYVKNERQFQFSFGMISGIQMSVENLQDRWKDDVHYLKGQSLYENNSRYMPEMAFKYHIHDLSFQLNLYNTLSGELTAKDWWWEHAFYSLTGYSQAIFGQYSPQFSTQNSALQFSASWNIGRNFSITAGFFTNRYVERVKYSQNGTDLFKLYTNYFDNLQLLFGTNYNYENIFSGYILARTQSTNVPLRPEKYRLHDYDLPANTGVVDFPGQISCGIQYRVVSFAKLSLEMTRHFLVAESKNRDNFVLYKPFGNSANPFSFQHDNWFSEISLGLNVQPVENVSLGVQYLKQLHYNYEAYNDVKVYESQDYMTHYYYLAPGSPTAFNVGSPVNFYTLNFSAEISYSYFTLGVYYQFNSMKYEASGQSIEAYKAQFLKATLLCAI